MSEDFGRNKGLCRGKLENYDDLWSMTKIRSSDALPKRNCENLPSIIIEGCKNHAG